MASVARSSSASAATCSLGLWASAASHSSDSTCSDCSVCLTAGAAPPRGSMADCQTGRYASPAKASGKRLSVLGPAP
eukprot:6198421-Pleurochrysis_carterae.AAC.1